jgi:PAS domain S-box-containing protein
MELRKDGYQLNWPYSDESYKSLIEAIVRSAPIGISVAQAPTGKAILYNEEAERILGHSLIDRKDETGYANYGAIHPGGKPYTIEDYPTIKSLNTGRTTRDEEMHYRRPDGKVVILKISSSPVLSEEGEILAAVTTFEDVTDKREAELEHRKLLERYESLLNWAGEGIFGIDLDGRVTFINAAAVKKLGYKQEELRGKIIHDLIHHSKEDGTPYHIIDSPVFRAFTGIPTGHITDEVFWRKDGTRIYVDYVSNPIVEDGKVVGAVVTFRNITDKKIAEQSYKEAKELSDNILSTTNALIIGTTPCGKIVFFNKACEQVSGWSKEDALSKSWIELLIPDYLRHSIKNSLSQEQSDSFQMPLVTKDGNERIISWNSSKLSKVQNKESICIYTGVDITDQKKAESLLKQSEERLHLATTASHVGIWDLNLQTGEAWRNDIHDQIFGAKNRFSDWSFEKFLGFVSSEDKERVKSLMMNAVEDKGSFQFECRIKRLDGEERWMLASGRVHFKPDGTPADRMLGTNFDITEQKKDELRLREALSTRDEFISVASHELKTPLTSMRMQIQLVSRMVTKSGLAGVTPDRLTETFRNTIQQIDRLNLLVEDMLNLIRHTKGQITYSFEKVNLSPIALRVIEGFK